MNSDWEAFAEDCAWYVRRRRVEVGETKPFDRRSMTDEFCRTFPKLGQLLESARVTAVRIDDRSRFLIGWNAKGGGSTGWLSPATTPTPKVDLFTGHQILLRALGGILERWNEPEDTWLVNLNEALTEDGSVSAVFINDYAELFTMDGASIPIDPGQWYAIAREANGNSTICHITSGRVLLFAPDHAFTHITPYPGCPEYTLYTINDAPDFVRWVETVASQWSRHVA